MSNQAVGSVYQTIIEEVINSSRVDFEENGVEESVLEELRQGWQQKLSQLDVARFPWDPKPEPPPAAPPAAAQPPPAAPQPTTQAHFSPTLSLPHAGTPGATGQNGASPDPVLAKQEGGIKQEPESQGPALPALPSHPGMDSAANRAAHKLQLQYGMRAASSINAMQDRMGQQQEQQQQTATSQSPQEVQPSVVAPTISNGQTDGPGDEEDFEGVMMQRRADGTLNKLGRVDIDRFIYRQISARAKAMEGGGLMLPLDEAVKHSSDLGSSIAASRSTRVRKGKAIAAHDGGDDGDDDDDDDDDEDAINSDLDDPEDDHDDDEVDDEGLGHIMLCMYDKVQRVKNKWKCTLKDGVLTVNGKEYVFHKATGEYEW